MESRQPRVYDKNFKVLIINKKTKKGNEERVLNNYDATVNTFSLGMEKVTVVEGTKEAALLARWLNLTTVMLQ